MIEKYYRKFFVFGFINFVNISNAFVRDEDEEPYINKKVRYVFTHLGLKAPKGDFVKWVKLIAVIEEIVSILIVFARFVTVLFQYIFTRSTTPQGLYLQAPLTWPAYRVKDMLRSLDGIEASSIKIPFIKNQYREDEVNVLSVVSICDIWDAFVSSCAMVFYIEHRYWGKNVFFRSYASFEFFLTCRFIKHVAPDNHIVYFNTFDRWAFLMCQAKTDVTFIQHGKLDYLTSLIRVGTPTVAYYISPEQQIIVEDTLFNGHPMQTHLRKMLQFTQNEVLNKGNGKQNVLIVSVMSFINDVNNIVELLSGKVNLYVKPHPGDKIMDAYMRLVDQYGIVILEKTAYPEVDVVLSYNSTLADEYDLAGVKVIRWDLLNNISEVKDLVLTCGKKQ